MKEPFSGKTDAIIRICESNNSRDNVLVADGELMRELEANFEISAIFRAQRSRDCRRPMAALLCDECLSRC